MKSRGKYGRVLRDLAPYLTLDKLLLAVAHYPNLSLKEEVKDFQGKIWSDRIWVELGEAPLDLKIGGKRYYHLLNTMKLSPWGNLLIETGDLKWVKTSIWVQYGRAEIVNEEPQNGKGVSYQANLVIWALRKEGLSYLDLPFVVKNPGDPRKSLKKALTGDLPWRVFTDREYIYLRVISTKTVIAMDKEGVVHRITRDGCESFNFGSQKIRFIKENEKSYYAITSKGNHIYFNDWGKIYEFNLSRTIPTQYQIPRGFWAYQRLFYNSESMERMCLISQDYSYPVDNVQEILQMTVDSLYLLPDQRILKKTYKKTGILPRESLTISLVLGINGRLYLDKSSPWGTSNYHLQKLQFPYRLFSAQSGTW